MQRGNDSGRWRRRDQKRTAAAPNRVVFPASANSGHRGPIGILRHLQRKTRTDPSCILSGTDARHAIWCLGSHTLTNRAYFDPSSARFRLLRAVTQNERACDARGRLRGAHQIGKCWERRPDATHRAQWTPKADISGLAWEPAGLGTSRAGSRHRSDNMQAPTVENSSTHMDLISQTARAT